jgi:capsular polysaccharide biosynthesis protein
MTVNLFRVRDAYYAPGFGVIISATGEAMWSTMVEAVYLTPDLTLLPYTERVGDETTLNVPREIETLDQVVVSMPWGALFNYGHFVLDCLPTVASVAEFPELGGYRFVFPPLKPWQRRHLQLLGVDEPLELDQPLYHVTDVVFTSCMSSFLHSPNVNYRTVREKQLARKTSTSIAYDKVYITRLGDPKRTFLSERALADRLESLGFAIVAPENHTIDEQIDIFGNANVIVGCAGAAFANALYCHGGATVVEITPIRMVMPKKLSGVWVSNICAIVGCNWRPYYCRDDPQDQPILVAGLERPEIGFSFDLDIDDLVGYIDRLMQG